MSYSLHLSVVIMLCLLYGERKREGLFPGCCFKCRPANQCSRGENKTAPERTLDVDCGTPVFIDMSRFAVLLLCISSIRTEPTEEYRNMTAAANGRFMYFAFGSNLLKERLQLANPSAIFCSTGRLKNYALNFGLWEKHAQSTWHGGVATIESHPGAEVWGVIWTLSNEHLNSLDNQEGVSRGMYSPLEVSVETDNGPMLCRTYQMNNFHACPPSPQYKQVVCLGAEQNGLPAEYLKRLEAIQTNNYSGPTILDQIKPAMKQ